MDNIQDKQTSNYNIVENIKNNVTNKGIYKITCLTNKKFYIGSSTNIRYRIQRHFKELEQNIHLNRYMQASFNKYGKDSFVVECIEPCLKELTNNELLNLEQKYLDALKPYNVNIGFNICQKAAFPPNRKGKKLSAEHKQNISKALKNKPRDSNWISPLKGKTAKEIRGQHWVNPRKGKTAKEICGENWIDPRKGKTYKEIYGEKWEIQRQKLINSHKEKPLTKEHKQNISNALKGRSTSIQHRQNLSKANRGRALSKAHKQNISKAKKGKQYRIDLITLFNIKTNAAKTMSYSDWRRQSIAIHTLLKGKIKTSKGWSLYNSGKLP